MGKRTFENSGELMKLKVNEIFYSLQGEGSRTGRPTVFIRLAGCNLNCEWCDTDHEIYIEMTIKQILDEVRKYDCRWVCATGGEPLLQSNFLFLMHGLTAENYWIQIETNGTLLEHTVAWQSATLLTVSPKYEDLPFDVKQFMAFVPKRGTPMCELKFVVDENSDIKHILFDLRDKNVATYLQPKSEGREAMERCVQLIKAVKQDWLRLSLQTHKIVGMR